MMHFEQERCCMGDVSRSVHLSAMYPEVYTSLDRFQ